MQLLSSRRWRAAVAGAAAFALVLTGCSAEEKETYTPPAQVETPLADDVVAQLQSAVDNAMAASGATGALVGVWVPWSGTWVTGVGTQGPDGPNVTTDMSFRVADVTRLMTCDVLYALADADEVSLDAPVTEHVSGVADMTDVTLVDLCNGTSGAASSEGKVKESWLRTPEREWGALELAGFGLGQKRVAPGTTYRDSDAGYLLLGLALERITGKSAQRLIQEYVAEPLGLEHTYLPTAAADVPGENPMRGNHFTRVDGAYDCSAPIDITKSSASIGFTDSGVVSTIEDIGRYAQAEAAQVLRTKDEPDRFANALPVSKSAQSWYQVTGGGFLVSTMIGQHGWTPGYATSVYADPETGLTVAVSLNNSSRGRSIVAYLSWELAAIASKAPAASGETAPTFALPFTAEEYHKQVIGEAICPMSEGDSGDASE